MQDDRRQAPPSPTPPPAGVEFKALLLLGLLVLLVAGAVLYVLYARGTFEASQRLVLVADDAEGVTVGMDLTFSGFPIGRVRRIALAEDGSTRIAIDVPRKDARWLRSSSVFVLTRGLLGTTQIKAYSGILSDPPLEPDAERKVLVGDATAELPRLVSEARELVRNLAALTSADSALAETLANLRETSARLNGPRGAVGVLFGNEADARKLVAALDRSNALLARLDGLAARADAQAFGPEGVVPEARATLVQLNAALADARETLKRVDAVLADTQAIAGNVRGATNDLDLLRGEVDASLRKVSRMIDEINRRWPFAGDAAKQELKLP
jgi:phospholipid/cholesterol/gamma-HCH transport system substrate-binding protein